MQDRKLPRRQHTTEFKVEATRLAESVGGHEVARRLGVPVATLGNWNVGADSNLSHRGCGRKLGRVKRRAQGLAGTRWGCGLPARS
jgi:transposase-like protein